MMVPSLCLVVTLPGGSKAAVAHAVNLRLLPSASSGAVARPASELDHEGILKVHSGADGILEGADRGATAGSVGASRRFHNDGATGSWLGNVKEHRKVLRKSC